MEKERLEEKLYCPHCKRSFAGKVEAKKCDICGAELLASRHYYLGNGRFESVLNPIEPEEKNYN